MQGHGIREDFTGPDPLRIEQHMADLPMPELCRQNEGSMTIFGTRAGQQLACVFSTPEGRCDGQINAGASAKQSVRCFEAILLRTPVYHGFCPRGPKILGEEAGRLPRIFKINPATLRSPLSSASRWRSRTACGAHAAQFLDSAVIQSGSGTES